MKNDRVSQIVQFLISDPTTLARIFGIFVICIVATGCARDGDKEVNTIGQFKVGDCLTVVTNICVVDGDFRTEDEADLGTLKQWATNFNKTVVYVPAGTTFKLESLIKHTRSSWNTGSYTYYTVELIGLDKEFKGQTFDASALSHQDNTGFSGKWEFGYIPERTSGWPAKHHPRKIIFQKLAGGSS